LTPGIRKEISSLTGRQGKRIFTEEKSNTAHAFIIYYTVDQESLGVEANVAAIGYRENERPCYAK
jgi:hypothetical protein